MSKKIKPLNVSPTIKCARYALLISGIVYGFNKRAIFSAYERSARPKREAMYKEQHIREYHESLKITRKELELLGYEINIPELPPGWEQNVE